MQKHSEFCMSNGCPRVSSAKSSLQTHPKSFHFCTYTAGVASTLSGSWLAEAAEGPTLDRNSPTPSRSHRQGEGGRSMPSGLPLTPVAAGEGGKSALVFPGPACEEEQPSFDRAVALRRWERLVCEQVTQLCKRVSFLAGQSGGQGRNHFQAVISDLRFCPCGSVFSQQWSQKALSPAWELWEPWA